MSIHFNSRQEAINHLRAKGFRPTSTGRWIKDELRATIHPTSDGQVVMVCVWQVPA